MHRVVGDRTCALGGAFTVAGLCRTLTGFATPRHVEVTPGCYHLPAGGPEGRRAGDDPDARRRWQAQLGGLAEALIARSIEA